MNKAHPILFSTDMVQSILAGRKTMTRRVIKTDAKVIQWQPIILNGYGGFFDENGNPVKCKYSIQDVLWVRETWQPINHPELKYRYKADHLNPKSVTWKPSIFMLRAASRITLEIIDIKIERLQDITEKDVLAEGIEPVDNFNSGEGKYPGQFYKNYLPHGYTEVVAKDSFQSLWQSINGEESWELNPFVWVIEFKKIDQQ